MPLSYSTALRDAKMNAIESTISTAPLLRVYSGSVPANVGASIGAATLLAEATLPANWLSDSASGSVSRNGTWTFGTAVATGTPTFFRVWNSAGSTAHIQGTAGVGSGDLNFNGTITSGQTGISVSTFTLTDGNA